MNETLISVTLAARKFSDCINRVRYHGMSFLLEKNGVQVARIIPVRPNLGSDLEQLAVTLRKTRQTVPSEAEEKQIIVKPALGESQPETNQRAQKPLKRPMLNW